MSRPVAVRIPVRSSLLASVGYSLHATLDLEFRNGALYRFFTVPRSLYQDLIAAESKGTYFNLNIRNRFPYKRIA